MEWLVSFVLGPPVVALVFVVTIALTYLVGRVLHYVLTGLWRGWLFITAPVRRVMQYGVRTPNEKRALNGVYALLLLALWGFMAMTFHGLFFG